MSGQVVGDLVEHVRRVGSPSAPQSDAVNIADPPVATLSRTGSVPNWGGGIHDALVKIPSFAGGGGGDGPCEPWRSVASVATGGAV